jgi:hypothetical protein
MSYGFITSNISSGGYKNIPVYSAGSGVHHLLFHLDGWNIRSLFIAPVSDECFGIHLHVGNLH